MDTGTVFDTRRSGRPRTSEENIERVRQAFQRSPMKSIRTAARQLELPRSTVHKVLHKNLRLYAYKVQMLKAFQPSILKDKNSEIVTTIQPQKPISRNNHKVHRPIIIKLANSTDKKLIFTKLKNLKKYNEIRKSVNKKPHYVTEHLPKQFQQERKALLLNLKRPSV